MTLPYPRTAFALEFTCVLLFFAVDSSRIAFGSSGNRSETLPPLGIMLGLSALLVAFYIYLLGFQVYVYALNLALSLLCTAGWSCCACGTHVRCGGLQCTAVLHSILRGVAKAWECRMCWFVL